MAQDTPDGQDENDERTGAQSEKDGIIERRSFLQLAGATSLAGASVLSTGTADAAETRHGITFDRVVDAVADLGVDDTGQQAIDSELASAAGDGTLVVFPPGTYRVNQQLTLKDVSNFGIAGSSGNKGDVEFVTDSGNALHWIVAVGGRNHLYENFTMQQTTDKETSFDNVWKLSDGLHIENVELAGFNPRDDIYETRNAMRPHITSSDGVGVIKDFVCTGGGVIDEYPNRRVPIWMGPAHEGELRLVNAHIEESGSHSIYAGRTNGCIRVEGGLFKNNDNTNLRLSTGHPDKLSWVRGAEVVIDTANAKNLPDGEHYQNVRGIKVESGFQGNSGLLIEDCDLTLKSAPSSQGLIKIEDNHGAVTVRNTRLHNEVDGTGFVVSEKPNYSDVDSPYRVVLDNVSITGSAANTDCAVDIRGRDGSVVKNSCIQRANEAGVRVVDSDNCAVKDSNVNVPGEATIFRNSSVTTSGITHSDTCPAPTFDGVDGGGGDTTDTSDGSDSTSDSGTSLDHTLDITGGGSGDVVDYTFSVDGELAGVSLNQEDSVSGTTGEGAVAGGTDTYAFSGSITDFSSNGDLTVAVDGNVVDTSQWGNDGSTSLDRTIEIVGTGVVTNYEFTVSGDLAGASGSLETWDDVSGSTANAYVTEPKHVDTYSFSGEITDFTFHEGEATVYVDGSKVDPATLGGSSGSTTDASDLPHTLEVTGGGSGNVVDYAITVDGEMAGVDLNSEDSVSGATAEGAVAGGTDTYAFSGSITDVSTSGDVTVTVDGAEVDVSQWTLPNTLAFDATGDTNATDYSFAVTGELVEDASTGPLESGDTVEGTSASGSVDGGVDAYRFSGDLSKLLVNGNAAIDLEDNDG